MIFLSRSDSGKRSAIILQRPSTEVPFEDSQRLANVDQKMDQDLLQNAPGPTPISEDDDAPPAGAIQRLAWYPKSLKFVFDQVQELNRFQETSDLYSFDLTNLKRERLTKGERAREASISPDEKRAVFVKLDAGRMHLAILNLEDKKTNIIYSPALQSRISWPLFLNEQEIIFAERTNGQELLKKISLPTGAVLTVLAEYPEIKYPNLTSAGLVFNSAKNGVSNLYLASSDLQTAKPVTHSSTMIAAAAYDSGLQEFYAAELGGRGFQIKRFPAQPLKTALPKVEPLFKDRYPAVQAQVSTTDKTQIEEYSVWPYMYPRYWIPSISFDQNGSSLGGSTGTADPLGKHAYQIAATYDSWKKETNSAFAYVNNTTSAILSLSGLDYHTNIINTATRYRNQQYQATSMWQALPVSTDLYAGVGWNWTARNFSQARREQNGPSAILNYSDYVQSGAQISPESGQSIGLQATEFLDNQALENEAFRLYQYSLQKYFSGWISHHVLMARFQGQYIDGKVSSPNLAFNINQPPSANLAGGGLISPFLIARGFLNGQFLGKSLNTANLEYRFPIMNIYRGPNNTAPVFFKRIHGAIVGDAVNVDGLVYKWDTEKFESADRNKIFLSGGLEIKLDMTLGYHIPMTIYGGIYAPQTTPYTKGGTFLIGLQL